jgi:hypothetical protein
LWPVCGDGGVGEEVAVVDLRTGATDEIGMAHPTGEMVVSGDVCKYNKGSDHKDDPEQKLEKGAHEGGMMSKIRALTDQHHIEKVRQFHA